VDERLLARHAREYGPTVGHECLARLVQGTVCRILGQEEIKPHKVRYYLERRDAEFEQKMAEVLCVYREVQVLKTAVAKSRKSHQASGDRFLRRKAANPGHRNDSTRFAAQSPASTRASRGLLVVHHSDFDVLIPSHSRMGKFFGGRRISMLRGTPG
jgi:hypothetical protein